MARVLRRAAAVIVSAEANAQRVRAFIDPDQRQAGITIVPYGIDPARLDGWTTETAVHGQEEVARVLFIGRLVHYKGVETLITAASEVNANLTIVGDGPLYRKLRAQVDSNALGQRVEFVRDADDATVGGWLRTCTMLVLPSTSASESFGISILEAMAFGKPVVVTEIGTGLDEVVRQTESGRIVPPNDPVALAEAINALLADPAERDRLGKNGRRALLTRYTAERMADDTWKIYTEVARRKEPEDATH